MAAVLTPWKGLVMSHRGYIRLVVAAFALVGLAAAPPESKHPRRAPRVLVPDEAAVAVARVQVASLLFSQGDPPKVLTLGKPDAESRNRSRLDLLGTPHPADPADGKPDRELRPVSLAEYDRNPKDAALRPLPLRLAIIAASFPYKKQVEEHARATGLRAAVPTLRFLGVAVQRRELGSDGKPLGPWATLDLAGDYKPFFLATGRKYEPEDPALDAIVFDGLVMPRLKLLRDRGTAEEYPAVERELASIEKTLEALKAGKPWNEDAFDPFVRPRMKAAPRPVRERVIPEHCLLRVVDVTVEPGRTYLYRLRVRMANPNWGRTDVAAPAQARDREIVSEWYEVRQPAVMGPELIYYAVDEKTVEIQTAKQLDRHVRGSSRGPYARDNVDGRMFNRHTMVWLQAHRWFESLRLHSSDEGLARLTGWAPRALEVTAGEWSVAERVPVYRGEYVGRSERVEVPYWRIRRGRSFIFDDGRSKKAPGAWLLFGYGLVKSKQPEAILVDFANGSVRYDRVPLRGADRRKRRITDESAGEVLILRPDGKLILRESARDTVDAGRIARLQRVRHRIASIKKD